MSHTPTNAQTYERLAAFISDNKRALFDRIAPERTHHVAVVLEDIYQPHNASACLRSCDCLGLQDVHIVERRNDYRPNNNVSMGSSKWLTLHHYHRLTYIRKKVRIRSSINASFLGADFSIR